MIERPHLKHFLTEQNSISKDLLVDLQKIVLSLQQSKIVFRKIYL